MTGGDRDQRWVEYDAPSEYVADGGMPSEDRVTVRPRRWSMAALGFAAGLGVLVVLAILLAALGSSSDNVRSHPHVDPLTTDGYGRLLEALADGPVGTQVLSVGFDRHAAGIEVRDAPGTGSLVYDWDGDLGEPADDGAVPARVRTFDLAAIDVDDWPVRCAAARALLGDDAAECSVSIAPPGYEQHKAWIEVRVEGPTSGNATIYYDRSGTQTGCHVFK